ncbi:hypothetical protein EAI_02396 [Harpegnathos saltator]|uniref:Uncharacterized protein n=1 Tax=Harpegnathos saltator TaxID=610380 RepID=E2BAD5_HARSA|nr:hypothetical protein EAI_02396 [Harpegnathos saltator]
MSEKASREPSSTLFRVAGYLARECTINIAVLGGDFDCSRRHPVRNRPAWSESEPRAEHAGDSTPEWNANLNAFLQFRQLKVVKDACHRATTDADAVPSPGAIFGISGVPPERYVAE